MVDKEFTRKTAKLVQEHTHSGKIKSTFNLYEINEKTIKKLEEDNASDTEKTFNLLRSIGISVEKGMSSNPYLHSIGEKAELISLLYKQRQKDTQQSLDELKELIKEINEAKKEQTERNMSTDVFSTYWILKEEKVPYGEEKAKDIGKLVEKYPHWKDSNEFERIFKQKILKIFTKSKIQPKKAVQLTNKLITILKGAKQ